ncbi:hypothetical protein [Streptomyces klenkii]
MHRPVEGRLLEAKENLQKMLAAIPLTGDERAAVDDGQASLDQLLTRLTDVPTRPLTGELKKLRGKEGILFRPADAAIGRPEGTRSYYRQMLPPLLRATCPATSRPPVPCTTRRSASRWTRGSSLQT